jgi:prophage maintenance system killer protein
MSTLIDDALEDFPSSEIWRIQTDGWQALRGPGNFRPQYYVGMDVGFDFIRKNDQDLITPELIEGIYHSAYGAEDDYQKSATLQKGYNQKSGSFEIFLPEPGLENTAGISEAGIPNLVKLLQGYAQTQGNRKYPFVELLIDRENELETVFDVFTATAEKDLYTHLKNAALCKDEYLGNEKRTEEKPLRLLLTTSLSKREEIIQFVKTDIETYYLELKEAQILTKEEERQTAVLEAIVHFIQKLHQTHYFADGNGRTFVFLLFNMLLLQNGFGLKITQTPAHYAGFSSQELLAETRADLDRFQSYKITAAKNYLLTVEEPDINQDQDNVKAQLLNCLNSDPLIAMAQINDLFLRISTDRMNVPKGYSAPSMSLLSWFDKTDELKIKGHNAILNLLRFLYVEKLNLLVDEAPFVEKAKQIGFGAKTSAQDVLKEMVQSHKISSLCESFLIDQAIRDYENATLKEQLLIKI